MFFNLPFIMTMVQFKVFVTGVAAGSLAGQSGFVDGVTVWVIVLTSPTVVQAVQVTVGAHIAEERNNHVVTNIYLLLR